MKNKDEILFWHKVKLKDGTYTNGINCPEKTAEYRFFRELNIDGRTVLDVGCWDGYFSFEAERMGAKRVVSLDDLNCRWGGSDGYNFLHEHFDSKAEYVNGNIYNLQNRFSHKEFDIVLAYGLLYHLSDPLLALNNLFYVCKDIISFEGVFVDSDLPILELIPIGYYNNDLTNIYKPSLGYLKMVAGQNGFTLLKQNDLIGLRCSLLYQRTSELDKTHKYSDSVFPPIEFLGTSKHYA